MILRPRQQKAVEDLRQAYRDGYRAPVLVMPTGGGKTATASVIIRSAVARGKVVWFLAHLREILQATSGKLQAEQIDHGFIMAGQPEAPERQVQIVMVQTASRRLGRYRKPDLIIIDEAHLAVAETYRKVLEDAGNPLLLHLTATPTRLDGRGMREVADIIINTCSTGDLIAEGLLVPVRYYAPSRPDLSGVRTIAGDYSSADLSDVMNKSSITGDAVDHYRRLAHGRQAVAFCTNITHAWTVAEHFGQAGYRAAVISGKTPQLERDLQLEELASGKLDVLVNCQLLVAGVDVPNISCIIQLAPTKSLTKYLQSIGRGLRTHPGKQDLIVLDHAGNAFTHGMPTDPQEWTLDGAKKRARTSDDVEPVRQCERCYFVHAPAPVCPNCGHVHPVKERKLQQTEGELAELTEVKRQQRQEVGKARTVEELRKIAEERGYKMGWVWQQMRIKQARGVRL